MIHIFPILCCQSKFHSGQLSYLNIACSCEGIVITRIDVKQTRSFRAFQSVLGIYRPHFFETPSRSFYSNLVCASCWFISSFWSPLFISANRRAFSSSGSLSLSVSLSLCLSVSLFLCLSVSLSLCRSNLSDTHTHILYIYNYIHITIT